MIQPPVGRGTIITYVDHPDRALVRAVAIGPELVDPETDTAWIPLVKPDCTATLADLRSITELAPDAPSPIRFDDCAGTAAVLARALDRLAADLVRASWDRTAQTQGELLLDFTRSVAPIEQALCMLAKAELDNGLSAVLGWLSCAADELDRGNLDGVTCGVLIANSTLKRLLAEQGQTPGRP